MGGRTGLIEARDWQAMLGVSWHRAQRSRLGGTHIASVTASMPVVPVDPLQVERAANLGGQDLVVGQIWRVCAQLGQVPRGHLFLDAIPVFRAFAQLVRPNA